MKILSAGDVSWDEQELIKSHLLPDHEDPKTEKFQQYNSRLFTTPPTTPVALVA